MFTVKIHAQNSSKIFKCDKCDRVFTAEQAMLNHKQRHKDDNAEKRHCCTLCPYSTKYSSHLKQHMFTHTGERPFKCTQCKAGFTQNSLLKKHLLTHVPKEEAKRASPERQCEKQSVEKQQSKDSTKIAKNFSLKQRLLSYTLPPKNPPKKFKCERCSKKFEDYRKLLNHLKNHKIREKPYKCTQCNKRFSEISFLKKHERKHPEKEEEIVDSDEDSPTSETTESSSD